MRTPCQEAPEAWVGNDPNLRAEAASECDTCPLLEACRREAEAFQPVWGVWAGVDYTPPERSRKTAQVLWCQNRECGAPIDGAGTRRRFCDDRCRKREGYLQLREAAA